jgi:hypothetical protein
MPDPSRRWTSDNDMEERLQAYWALTCGRQPRPACVLLDVCERYRRVWAPGPGQEKANRQPLAGYREVERSRPVPGASATTPGNLLSHSRRPEPGPAGGARIVSVQELDLVCHECAMHCRDCPVAEEDQ